MYLQIQNCLCIYFSFLDSDSKLSSGNYPAEGEIEEREVKIGAKSIQTYI